MKHTRSLCAPNVLRWGRTPYSAISNEAQRERVRFEKEERRNERAFAFLDGSERYGVVRDDAFHVKRNIFSPQT